MLDQRAFTFPFEDEDWVNKFLIGSLLHLIAPFLLYLPIIVPRGYSLRVWRDAVVGLPPRLTEWEDWEEMGLRGLAYYGIILLYSLPVLLLWGLVIALTISGGVTLAWIMEALESGGMSEVGRGLVPLIMVGGVGLATVLALAVSLLVGFVYPVAVGRYLDAGRFGAAFEVGAVWQSVQANLGGLVVAWVIMWVIGLAIGTVVGVLSLLLCFIPFVGYLFMAPVSFYLSLVQARLMGQVYHEAQRRLGGKVGAVAETPSLETVPVVPEPGEKATEPTAEPLKGTSDATEASVETLGLSSWVMGGLAGAGITTVGQVLERLAEGDAALLAIRGIGPKALSEIKAQLAACGFIES